MSLATHKRDLQQESVDNRSLQDGEKSCVGENRISGIDIQAHCVFIYL